MAAISSAVSAGFAPAPGAAATALDLAGRAAMSNAVSQGVGIVAGLQDGFKWSNVATSYASAYGGAQAGAAMQGALKDNDSLLAGVLGQSNQLAVRTVSGFAAGATASILSGGKMNVTRIATDAFVAASS